MVKLLFTEPQEVLQVLNYFYEISPPMGDRDSFTILKSYTEQMQRQLIVGPVKITNEHYEDFYCSVAKIAMYLTKKPFNENEFANFLHKKHMMYGAEPLLRWKHLGIIMRIDAKVSRINNMLVNKLKSDSESIEDNLKDIVGYCVHGILIIQKGI